MYSVLCAAPANSDHAAVLVDTWVMHYDKERAGAFVFCEATSGGYKRRGLVNCGRSHGRPAFISPDVHFNAW